MSIKWIITLLFSLLFLFVTPVESEQFCNGARFEPCICWQSVPKDVSYSPADKLCGGNASVTLRGKLYNSFSVVVRDKENSDRWPVSGFNGCSYSLANSESPPNRCSAFKAQKIIKRKGNKIYCLGKPGTDKLFRNVVRITVKVSDLINPKTGTKDIRRYCLRSPKLKLN